jgi:hypothetical protein
MTCDISRADVDLWYGPVKVGRVTQVSYSDSTWYGIVQNDLDPGGDSLQRRLHEFILFCVEWHARIELASQGQGVGPDASEFDAFDDVVQSGEWWVRHPGGRTDRIDPAPVFFPGDELSWRVGGDGAAPE